MKSIMVACLIAIALPMFAVADEGKARAAIERANAQFSAAYERGDAAAVAAMYTEDAIVFPPGGEMVKGRAAIERFWKDTMSTVKAAALTTLDVEVSGEMACEVGKVDLKIVPQGQQPATASAKYVVVWKRQADGSWKLHRDIWNDLPTAKP